VGSDSKSVGDEKVTCAFCKERAVYARELCVRCYHRANQNERRTGKFDPTPNPNRRSRTAQIACAACGRVTKHYARGLCRPCWALGNAHERSGKGFSPVRQVSPGSLPKLAGSAFGVLRYLAATPELDHRRFKRFGATLAREIGVSREYVRQILVKLQRRKWITYHLTLSDAAKSAYEALEREQNGQLTFPWAWTPPFRAP
jgi:hypothetical protein